MSDLLSCYEKCVAAFPEVERKGKTMPYTSLNGHMFSFLSKDGSMGLRLSADDRDQFIKKYNAQIMVQHERQMKEFVLVPEKVWASLRSMKSWFQKSFDYTASLKPKK